MSPNINFLRSSHRKSPLASLTIIVAGSLHYYTTVPTIIAAGKNCNVCAGFRTFPGRVANQVTFLHAALKALSSKLLKPS